ncbi:hypothetical protein M0R72_15785 [Candidatus Pacearchaeota archaeon]|jgi:hypothetical protein|nr:hypothetical protein [Candidatus Pacearchaeota archaeon]
MAYTKNENPWEAGDLVTPAKMDNFETIYTEASSYLTSHNHDALYQTKTEMEAAYWYAGNDGSGSGSDADLLYKSTGNLHAASFAGLGVPTGLVILWYGATGDIPSGWHLCDGTEGTIDLRGKLTVGAGTGSAYSVGDTGGSATFTASGAIAVDGHTLTVAEMGPHRHPFSDLYGDQASLSGAGGVYGADTTSTTGNTSNAGGGGAHGHSTAEGTHFDGSAAASLPFYLALCYIQKI